MVVFHVDLDAFFASVEQVDNPQLRGQAVIIGAAPGHRGVVAACSYEARAFGVRSAMPISEAYRRCPAGVYLPVRMGRYHEVSKRIMAMFARFTPDVRQISVDEASLDMSGTSRLFGPPLVAAQTLKKLVKDETGLTISVGIAPNRYLAKLASEYKKPDGLYEIAPGTEIGFLDTLALKDLWGLGKKTLARLNAVGIHTLPVLRARTREALQAELGTGAGGYLYNVVRGIDPGIYQDARKSRSISSETTFEQDTNHRETIRRTILELSHHVMYRVIEERMRVKTVFVKIRFSDFRTVGAQRALIAPPGSAEDIDAAAMELLETRWTGEPLRLIGVGVSAPVGEPEGQTAPVQGELFADEERPSPTGEKRRKLEEAVHRMVREGNEVVKASLLSKEKRRRP